MADQRPGNNNGSNQTPNSPYRTDSLEVEYNSSRAAPSTTQSVENYDSEIAQASEVDPKAALVGAGGQFQGSSATPARSAPIPEPKKSRFRDSTQPPQHGDTTTTLSRPGNYSVQSLQAQKRRGSTLDDDKVAQRYRDIPPGSGRQQTTPRLAQLSSRSNDQRARIIGTNNEILESPTSLSGNEGSYDGVFYEDGAEHDDDDDDDDDEEEEEGYNKSGSDQPEEDEGTGGPSTPRP